MLLFLVVLQEMGLHIPAAADQLALHADPILLLVPAVVARCFDCDVFKFFNWGDVFWKAVGTLVDRADGMEPHNRPDIFIFRRFFDFFGGNSS